MRRTPGVLPPLLIGLLALAAASCSQSPTVEPGNAQRSMPDPATLLWGDLKPVVSVKELMRDMIDPIADYIFDAVSSVVTRQGVVEKVPRSDEDWDRIRIGAVSIAEAAYLLKVRRPFAPEGDLNDSVGPNAVELSPTAITQKIEKDPVEWNARIETLRNVGLEVMDIVKRRNAQELWDAAENLDRACEDCHKSYWYPGEDARFYERREQILQEYLRRQPGSRPNGPE
jgi:hypothetical protein